MKPAPAPVAEESLLQYVSVKAAASEPPLRPHWIGEDARRQKALRHSILAVALCVLITATLMVTCYKRSRVHAGATDRGRRLADDWFGQGDGEKEEESWILDSCLDLESELALPTHHLNPLQNEQEAIQALTLNLLAEAERFESGAYGPSSSFLQAEATLTTQSASGDFPAFSLGSPTNIGFPLADLNVSQEVFSEPFGVESQEQEEYMARPPCAYATTASDLYSQQPSSSYQQFDSSSSQFEQLGMPGSHISQDTGASFTSDPLGLDLEYLIDSSSTEHATTSSPFLQFTDFSDLSQFTPGQKRPLVLADGGEEDAPTQKTRRIENERGDSETGGYHYTDGEGDGFVAQSQGLFPITVSQPSSAATQQWPSEPHASHSTRSPPDVSQGPYAPENVLQQFLQLPPNPTLLEGGEAIIGEALKLLEEEEEEEIVGLGYVSIRLRTGEEIRVPHPPPPLEPGCHESYRLPRVPEESFVAEFDKGSAFGPVRFRSIPVLMHVMHLVFSRSELSGDEVSGLCEASEEIVNYLVTHHRTSVQNLYPHRAADRLAVRYLCFEALVCAIQTLGPAMHAQKWFPALVEAIPTEYYYYGGTRLARAVHFKNLSSQLSEALELLKRGIRPSPEITLNLKRILYDRKTAPFIFKSTSWDFARKAFLENPDLS